MGADIKKVKYLTLIVLIAFSACTFTLPNAIQFLGSPALRVTANIDFNEELLKRIEDGFDAGDDRKASVLDCPANEHVQTYLAHMTIEEDYEIVLSDMFFDFFGMNLLQLLEYFNVEIVKDFPVYDSRLNLPSPITLPLATLGEYFNDINFNLDGSKAKLYFFTEFDLMKNVYMEIEFVAVDEDGNELVTVAPVKLLCPKPGASIEFGRSGIQLDSNSYLNDDLPVGGVEIDDFLYLLNEKNDVVVNFRVFIPEGTIITRERFQDVVTFTAELAVWLPLSFDAAEGAELTIGSFDEAGDFIENISDMVKSFSVNVKTTQQNLFKEGILNIRQPDTDLEIIKPLNTQSLNFAVSPADMRKIKALGRNFEPEIIIKFPQEQNIIFPRNLGITTISLDAVFDYSIGL